MDDMSGQDVVARLRGGVVAAALTPLAPDGRVDRLALERYVAGLAERGVAGVAAAVHTGRGPFLEEAARREVVAGARAATDGLVVAGVVAVGSAPGELVASAERAATDALAAGADALLVFPPRGLDPDTTVTLHAELGRRTGAPLLGFTLYERASGNAYTPSLVAELVRIPEVVGIKVAMLNDAIACQDIIAAAREADPSTVVLTGEDRMFGASLTWGADGALIGLAAALPEVSVDLVRSWRRGDAAAFVDACRRSDVLAAATFREPMEGYVQRMGWLAAWQGLLAEGAARDRFGPPLDGGERDRVLAVAERLAAEWAEGIPVKAVIR